MITIRLARASDLEHLVPLLRAYLLFYQRAPERARVRRFLAGRLSTRPVRIWVACDDTALVGFAQVYTTWSTLSLAPAWTLNDLYVAEPARGLGVGRRLVAGVVAAARRERVAHVQLMTAVDNGTARALYDSMNFDTVDEFVTYSLPLTRNARPRNRAERD